MLHFVQPGASRAAWARLLAKVYEVDARNSMKPVQVVDHARFAMGEGRVLLFPDAALPPGSSPTVWLCVPRVGAFASGR